MGFFEDTDTIRRRRAEAEERGRKAAEAMDREAEDASDRARAAAAEFAVKAKELGIPGRRVGLGGTAWTVHGSDITVRDRGGAGGGADLFVGDRPMGGGDIKRMVDSYTTLGGVADNVIGSMARILQEF